MEIIQRTVPTEKTVEKAIIVYKQHKSGLSYRALARAHKCHPSYIGKLIQIAKLLEKE